MQDDYRAATLPQPFLAQYHTFRHPNSSFRRMWLRIFRGNISPIPLRLAEKEAR